LRFVRAVQLEGFRAYQRKHTLALNHVNIFAGPNNAGKSALILALRRLGAIQSTDTPCSWHDVSDRGFEEAHLRVKVGRRDILARLQSANGATTQVADGSARVEDSLRETSKDPVAHVRMNRRDRILLDPADLAWVHVLRLLPVVVLPDHRQPSWPLTTVANPSNRTATGLDGVREEIVEANQVLPALKAWRPTGTQRQAFLLHAAALLGRKVVLPHDLEEHGFVVHLGGQRLPPTAYRIEDLGAGVLELLTVALALARYEGGLLLYEEPEQHLHPRLQRLVMRHLVKQCRQGSWQVVVSTHSNHILDIDERQGVSIFLVNEAPYGEPRVRRAPIHGLLDSLGVRASSLNEPNALIWVEGPSDAIYLRHFLHNAHPELVEHRDFTFGFLGGSLLDHASAAVDPTGIADSLLALFRVHPGSCIVIDSDRAAPEAPMGKPYAARFVEAAKDHGWGDRVWITAGREMENYLPDALLEAVGKCTSSLAQQPDAAFMPFEARIQHAGGSLRGGKVRFARAAVEHMTTNAATDWQRQLGLRTQIDRLAKFIADRRAPGDDRIG
jgi:AAA domain, putative AbiEii toxin, Type IV TA system